MRRLRTSEGNARRWAGLALRRLSGAISKFLGMDLHEDGSVTVHGLEQTRRTVDLMAPFGPVAHSVQLLRDQPEKTLRFYQSYSQACFRLGRRAQSFEGQLEAFHVAMDEVPCEARPTLRRVA